MRSQVHYCKCNFIWGILLFLVSCTLSVEVGVLLLISLQFFLNLYWFLIHNTNLWASEGAVLAEVMCCLLYLTGSIDQVSKNNTITNTSLSDSISVCQS